MSPVQEKIASIVMSVASFGCARGMSASDDYCYLNKYSGISFLDEQYSIMWGAYDRGLASSYFVLAAKNHGWDSLILGIRDAAKIRAQFAIPDDEILTSVIVLGRSAQFASKPPRKPVKSVVMIS